jgi:hypothetical protein
MIRRNVNVELKNLEEIILGTTNESLGWRHKWHEVQEYECELKR